MVKPYIPEEVEKLLAAERSIALTWWTILNEMGSRGELPEWATRMAKRPGASVDHAEWKLAVQATNAAVTGMHGFHRYAVEDASGNLLIDGFSTLLEADNAAKALNDRYPNARSIRILCDDVASDRWVA